MKKMKVFKSALAVLTSSAIVLFSGCSANTKTPQKEESGNSVSTKSTNKVEKEKPIICQHLTVCFGEEFVTFKECEGYDIYYSSRANSGIIRYSIEKDNKSLIENGVTTLANCYRVYHDEADQTINNKSIQKVK